MRSGAWKCLRNSLELRNEISNISQIASHPSGEVWISSQPKYLKNGLRYLKSDVEFTFREKGSPTDIDFIAIKENELFVAALNNIYVHEAGRWHVFQKTPNPGSVISCLYWDDSGDLWCGTHYGLYVFENDDWRLVVPDKKITSLVQIDSVFWLGTDSGLYTIQDGVVQSVTFTLPSKKVLSLCTDQDKNLFIGTANGLVFYNGYHKKPITLDIKNSGLSNQSVNTLACDGCGSIWMGTNCGVDRFVYKSHSEFSDE